MQQRAHRIRLRAFTQLRLPLLLALFATSSVAIAQETNGGTGQLVEVHGFVSQGFIKTTANNYLAESKRGSLEFTEVGLNFTRSLSDQLRVGVQLFARDLGPLGNYVPHFDWFYLDYRMWDWLGIRAGRTKLPFGLYNETNDVDAARVPVLLPQSVYPVQNRDFLLAQTGTELYGNVSLGAAGSLEYRLYGGTIFLDISNSSTATRGINLDVPYLVGGRVLWSPIEGLRLGGSLQSLRLDFDYTPNETTLAQWRKAGRIGDDFVGPIALRIPATLWVLSAEYQLRDLLVAAEYSKWDLRVRSSAPTLVPETPTISERMYVMTSYRVNSWFTPGVYYSLFFPRTDNRSGRAAYQHDAALTLRYDLTTNLILKLEGHLMHGTAGLSSALNHNVPLAALNETWGTFLAKATAYF